MNNSIEISSLAWYKRLKVVPFYSQKVAFTKSRVLTDFANIEKKKSCLCEVEHQFRYCSYILSHLKQSEFKSNSTIEKMMIDRIINATSKLKVILNVCFKRNVSEEKLDTIKSDNKISIENFDDYSSFAMFSTFVTESNSYKLLNCWILDCATNIHVCNDLERFQLDKSANSSDRLRAEKTIYFIKKYETINILVKDSDDLMKIKLIDVVLASDFLINLICLKKFVQKEIHWDIFKRHLYRNDVTYCYTQSINEHWVLENNSFSSEEFETFNTQSNKARLDLTAVE